MATKPIEEVSELILSDPDYQKANAETKGVIFARMIAKHPEYANANAETQAAIQQLFGLGAPAGEAVSSGEAKTSEAKPPAPKPTPSIQEATGVTPEGALVGGVLAGGAGTLLPKVTGTTEAQVARAKERLATAIDRFKATREAAARSSTFGIPIEDIQAAQDAARAEVEAARNELATLNQSLKEASRTAPTAISEAVEALPSRTVPGASGAQNWARAMATQELPESLLEQVTTMRKTGEGGAQRLIDLDLERMRRIQAMGEGEQRLVGQGKGQLMLPPEEAARVERELAERQAAQAAEQARMAEIAERERLLRESELRSQQQAAKGKVREAGERARKIGELKREATQIQKGLEKSGTAVDLARKAAERAEEARLGPAQRFGAAIGSSKILGPLLGGLGAVGTYMSIDEAIRRYNAGDYSGMVIPTLEAAFGAMSLVPAWNPITAGIKGIGTLGGLGLTGYQAGKYLYDQSGKR